MYRESAALAQGFYTQYAHARDIGLDCLAERVLEVAETPLVAEKRVQKADGSVEITTADAVDRSRLTVDSLKWYLCKLAPKKYGDKVDATLDHSGSVSTPRWDFIRAIALIEAALACARAAKQLQNPRTLDSVPAEVAPGFHGVLPSCANSYRP